MSVFLLMLRRLSLLTSKNSDIFWLYFSTFFFLTILFTLLLYPYHSIYNSLLGLCVLKHLFYYCLSFFLFIAFTHFPIFSQIRLPLLFPSHKTTIVTIFSILHQILSFIIFITTTNKLCK